jgi:DNA-binding transcriptional ArsR family regulator
MNEYREDAHLLKVMAHPMRLEILGILRWSDECVCHLSAALKKPQPYVSQQLAILRKEGLIEDHKDGTNVFYGLTAGDLVAGKVTAILGALVEEEPARPARGHRLVDGCPCPKCGPGGTCEPRK